ncbi:MAG: tRNA pseudouridine(38-40) synthase TruA [Dehalococcoidia bacterium]
MIELRRLALVVEYEGTGYRGFQWQLNGPTIQEELESALEKLTGQKTRVAGAGRTDTGVHARGQVVSFTAGPGLSSQAFVVALNHYLPLNIAVKRAVEVHDSFDVRRDAYSRRYKYSILNSRTPSPIRRLFTHQVRGPLDVEAMDAACKSLIGAHDFASFCGPMEAPKSGSVRNVFDARVTSDDGLVTLEIEANSFLTHQVRRTIGELVEVGLGKKMVEEFGSLIDCPSAGSAGPTLPARGLCLEEVVYTDLDVSAPHSVEGLVPVGLGA